MSKARECGNKVPFVTRKAADKRAFELKRRKLVSMHPYKCKHCKLWHVGHSSGLARFR